MDLIDLEGFKQAYPPWLDRNRAALEAKDWASAFKDYPHLSFAEAPWTTLGKPLAECRVALLSTAGVYVAGDQPPFSAENEEGDWGMREIPMNAEASTLAIAHTHYDHQYALADLNCVYPVERLKGLQAQGVFAELAPTVISISGYCTRADLLMENTTPAIVARLKAMEVDALLHIPV